MDTQQGIIAFPTLPALKHVKLWNISIKGYRASGSDQFNPYNWILDSQKNQLISIDMSGWFETTKNVLLVYPLLTNFKLWKDNHAFTFRGRICPFQTFISFPSLQKVSIGLVKNSKLSAALGFLSQFKNSLLTMHLDVDCWSDIPDYVDGQNFSHKFLLLKSFSIAYYITYDAKMEDDIRSILKMFPNLENLKFTLGRKFIKKASKGEQAAVKKHLELNQYWEICPKLRVITVVLKKDDSVGAIPFKYVRHAPFSG